VEIPVDFGEGVERELHQLVWEFTCKKAAPKAPWRAARSAAVFSP
jgi:hypothetical protein